jgi:hypothetical protein
VSFVLTISQDIEVAATAIALARNVESAGPAIGTLAEILADASFER